MPELPENDAAAETLSAKQVGQVIALAIGHARRGETAALMEFLDHGLPVDAPDGDGNTALMLASYHGQADTVTALIARGADVDLRNDRDQSPLAGAVFKGNDEVVGILLAAGANPDAGTPTARAAAGMFGREDLLG